jgi:HPt (histidine-containing phosphotransfer) domain-containing protein
MPGEAERCRSAGMDDFLGKPAPMPALVDMLRRWMPDLRWTAAEAPEPPTPTPTHSSCPEADAVIDGATLDEMTGGDAELAATILLDYIQSTFSDIEALDAALGILNEEEVRRGAHRILGASRIVGAEQVATVAAGLQRAASADVDWPGLLAIADDLHLAVARVAALLGDAKPAR